MADRPAAGPHAVHPSFAAVHLYCFTPGGLPVGRDPLNVVADQIKGGADVIQLREKGRRKRECLELGMAVRRMTRKSDVLFIVNDDVDLALILDADGVHLGQDDIPIQHARPLLKDKIVGISTHSLDQVREAVDAGADYVGIGPIFETKTKADTQPVVGIDMLRRLNALCPIPYVAIGGITADNLGSVVRAGCRRAAVVSDIVLARDVVEQCRRLKGMLL
ncbi:MAG: thiamine phosphate synthase [Deltaproteobacteria bacterium]|nr:thiamine phosphate synthase [Deltaproteobacteria bacterium]MBW2283374.1 thiamine phosphate synthase [Deltaproteobacteria bacterium]